MKYCQPLTIKLLRSNGGDKTAVYYSICLNAFTLTRKYHYQSSFNYQVTRKQQTPPAVHSDKLNVDLEWAKVIHSYFGRSRSSPSSDIKEATNPIFDQLIRCLYSKCFHMIHFILHKQIFDLPSECIAQNSVNHKA